MAVARRGITLDSVTRVETEATLGVEAVAVVRRVVTVATAATAAVVAVAAPITLKPDRWKREAEASVVGGVVAVGAVTEVPPTEDQAAVI